MFLENNKPDITDNHEIVLSPQHHMMGNILGDMGTVGGAVFFIATAREMAEPMLRVWGTVGV